MSQMTSAERVMCVLDGGEPDRIPHFEWIIDKKVREAIINAISPSMKNGIAVGIGLFIAFIGLRNAGIITESPGTLVQLSEGIKQSTDVLIFAVGVLGAAVLHVRRVRGSILIGIAAAAVTALLVGRTAFDAETAKIVSLALQTYGL